MRFIPLNREPLLHQACALVIGRGTRAARRDAIAVALGLHGLRVEEVCQAEAKDFSPTACILHVRTIKGGIPRDAPLHESLASALVAWRRDADPRARWLLPTSKGNKVAQSQFQRFARKLTHKVYGEAWRFHALRHTFAMRVLDQTDDLLLVKKLMGHSSIASTMQYVEARKTMPETCKVNLDSPFAVRSYAGAQLRLFVPESG